MCPRFWVVRQVRNFLSKNVVRGMNKQPVHGRAKTLSSPPIPARLQQQKHKNQPLHVGVAPSLDHPSPPSPLDAWGQSFPSFSVGVVLSEASLLLLLLLRLRPYFSCLLYCVSKHFNVPGSRNLHALISIISTLVVRLPFLFIERTFVVVERRRSPVWVVLQAFGTFGEGAGGQSRAYLCVV